MLIYWLMLLIPGILYVLLRPLKDTYRNRTVISVFFLFFGMMLFLRSADCGIDLRTYEYYFHHISQFPWGMLDAYDLEYGFVLYVKLMSIITDDYQVFIMVTSVIYFIPVVYLYQRYARHSFLQILLFVNMSTFPMFFSGLRQCMAIAIGIVAYCAVVDGKKLRYLLLTGLACLFHESAFILLMLYPMYHVRIRQKHTIALMTVLGLLLLFNEQIFLLIGSVAEMMDISYSMTVTNTGAFMTIVLFFLFFLFSMVALDEEKADDEVFFMRNLLLLALVIQIFSPLHNTVTRVGYYFLPFIPILLSEVFHRAKRQYSQIMLLAYFIMCAFFFFYFFQSAYSGQDKLRIYPYIPFWEGM